MCSNPCLTAPCSNPPTCPADPLAGKEAAAAKRCLAVLRQAADKPSFLPGGGGGGGGGGHGSATRGGSGGSHQQQANLVEALAALRCARCAEACSLGTTV